LESHWALATGQLNVLSEQHILSCTPNPYDCGGSGGCGGGTTELAYEYLVQTGLASEWKYPYLSWYGNNSQCRYTADKVGSVAYLADYVTLPTNDYFSVLNAVAFIGPLAVSVDASQWHLYESGIFNDCNNASPDIDHGVQLVGYGSDKGTPYWIIRNSWTPSYGENGYIRIFRDDPPVCGVDVTPLDGTGCVGGPSNVTVCGNCGILFDVVYPIVKIN
jgi:cathepsin L